MKVTIQVVFCSVLLFSQLLSAQSTERRDPEPQVRYPLGEDSLPQKGVPKGKLEGPFLFHSKIIENTVRKYWVSVPAQYSDEKPAAVLVFQDGARAINPQGVIRVPQVLDNLIHKKQIPVTIGIYITPGQRGEDFPDTIGTGNPDNRDREYDVLTDDYARMVIEEILPEVGKKYKLSKDPRERAIGGSSSGAICAFTVAWERPEEFQNVVSFIGSFTNIHGGHVYPEMIRKEDKKPIRIFLQDGVNDLRSPNNLERDWHIQNQKMVAAFEEKGYDMAYVFGRGGHSDDHGGSMLPQMLRWIWRDHPDVQHSTDASELITQAKSIKPEQTELFPGFEESKEVDPSGEYLWENRFGPRTVKSKLVLKKADGSLAGVYRTDRGEESIEVQIGNPEMQGNKLLFDVTMDFRGRELTTTYQGIVSEAGIVGWRMMDFAGQKRDSRWEAERLK